MDASYDYEDVYTQVYQMNQQSVIAYNKLNESEPIGFDKCFAITCFWYDSYDAKYETLKYTRPRECKDCHLANEDICQKVFKMKITTDFRRYMASACGSNAWKNISSKGS